jgi:hypothetical protein
MHERQWLVGVVDSEQELVGVVGIEGDGPTRYAIEWVFRTKRRP